MNKAVSIDGQLVAEKDAKISVLDHGLLYGDGLFEGIRVRAGRIFRLEQHLARLELGARALGLDLPFDGEGRARIVRETVRAFAQKEAYVRLLVTRGEGPLGVDPSTCKQPTLVCIVAEIGLYSAEQRAQGLTLITSSYRRPSPDVQDVAIKTLNYLGSALAKQEAKRQGADEALLLNQHGGWQKHRSPTCSSCKGARFRHRRRSMAVWRGSTVARFWSWPANWAFQWA